MEVYLDNSATTKAYKKVADVVNEIMIKEYGNPSSAHTKGFEAEKYIKNSKKIISNILKVSEKEVYFTSGGTESNNLAIIGAALANKRSGNHIITTEIEHPSVYNSMKYLEEIGFEVTYLPVNENGVVELDELIKEIKRETILVSIMYVNNEIGSVQLIEEIGSAIKIKNKNIIFHTDAVQAFGKYKIYPKKIKADLISVSGHKIHGPKGIGFLYKKESIKIKPLFYGGGQQNDIRPGTENVSGIAGLGVACEEIYKEIENEAEKLKKLKEFFVFQINEIEDIIINSKLNETFAPHIISISFKGIKSEVLLHALEEKQIFVSSGSACSTNKKELSKTLKALGIDKEYIDGTIRFSLSEFTTKEELEICLDSLKEIVPKLRLYKRH